MHVSASLLVVSAVAAVLDLTAAHFVGSFHNIMMMTSKNKGNKRLSWKGPMKMARFAPSPPRMWAIIDPPGSLGDLGDESIHTNRIARSLKSIDEVQEIEAAEHDARVVRSVSNRRDARQEGGEEDVTEAPEDVTEAPESDVTEAPEEEVEEETEPPVTTPAPVICGGDLTTSLDPNTVLTDTEGRFFHEDILSPGFEDGEYPEQGFECEWTIGVGTECSMGMIMFVINEGQIRETARCTEDHLAVSYRGQQENKFCGMLRQGQHQVSGTDIWTEPTSLAMKITFRAAERGFSPGTRSVGQPLGFNMTVSSYCWSWNPEFLAGTSAATTPTTSTTTTTTEAPSDEPVTTISEDGQGYEDENVEGDTATAAPEAQS